MTDHYRDQRAEATSADVRMAEKTLVGRDAARSADQLRSPAALHDIRGIVTSTIDRAVLLRNRIGDLATRTFGEVPPATETGGKGLAEGPPYGGDMAELFYVVQQLSSVVDDANRQFNRLENIA